MLRYLSDVYKTLVRTVPERVRTEELGDLTEWLGELVRQTDSSLLDEWEELVNPQGDVAEVRPLADASAPPRPVTGNARAFRVLVRNAMFRRVELAALGRWEALGAMDADAGWGADAWQDAIEEYLDEYDTLGTGPAARGPALFMVTEEGDTWRVRQTFDDPAGDRDWGISAEVDLPASDAAGEAVVRVLDVGPA